MIVPDASVVNRLTAMRSPAPTRWFIQAPFSVPSTSPERKARRNQPLLLPAERGRVQVVVALAVAALVDDPGDASPGDGDLAHARAGARAVGVAGLRAADDGAALGAHVPDEDLRAAAAALDRVGDARAVHGERLDPALRVLDAWAGRPGREREDERGSDEPEEPVHGARSSHGRAKDP